MEIAASELEENSSGAAAPSFAPLDAATARGVNQREYRRLRVPPHRYTPLREQWDTILTPLVTHMGLQVRFNPKNRSVELRTSEHTSEMSALQKGADFVAAFLMGFEVQDAIALLRLEDLYIDSFMMTDVKMLSGDHLSRAIGRVCGDQGKTKFAIENATRTRIVVHGQKVHILGSFNSIKIARNAISSLVIGAQPGKVYNHLKNVARRMKESY